MGTVPKKLVDTYPPGTPVLSHSQWMPLSQSVGLSVFVRPVLIAQPWVGGGLTAHVLCLLSESAKHLVQGKAIYCDTWEMAAFCHLGRGHPEDEQWPWE